MAVDTFKIFFPFKGQNSCEKEALPEVQLIIIVQLSNCSTENNISLIILESSLAYRQDLPASA